MLILSFSEVRLRAGRPSEAFSDLEEALTLCRSAQKDPLVAYDELPKVLVARGGALRALRRYAEALNDYDEAQELFGEPDFELLSGRARAKLGLEQPLKAFEDFQEAAELLRSAGRRPEEREPVNMRCS